MTTEQQETVLASMTARQIMASALASALADPRSPLALRSDGSNLQIVKWAWDRVRFDTGALETADIGLGERLPGDVEVESLIRWLSLSVAHRERAHQRIYGLVMTKLCPSYETEYCSWTDATHRAQELADIAGFYRAFGVCPNRDAPERFDHVSLEIEFLAILIEKERLALLGSNNEQAEICRDARTAFIREHASWWMPTFGRLLEKRANALRDTDCELTADLAVAAGVARVICAWMLVERSQACVAPSRRIISPSVAPQEAGNSCDSCGGCEEVIGQDAPSL